MTAALPRRSRIGPLRFLLYLAPLFIGAPLLSYKLHYALPKPNVALFDSVTSLPQLSEAEVLSHSKYLSEDIGYRTVGTREHALGDAWMYEKAKELKRQCDEIIKKSPNRKLECEVWRQEGSGSHRFDMMGKRLYKTYRDLSNIVMRVSDGTERGKEHAVLVNSHLDSTLPSPGASDDAISVGVMIECVRVLINTPDWEPTHAIIFLWNNAEESLQDGSHLYSTQHPTAKSVRAAINLESAGTEGRELLFQATSEQMIQAYSHVPRPFGTIVANEVFSSGIMLSDTDFRQFEQYLNVTGLDMAIVGNSYLYHTRLDRVEHIQAGVAQHMAENALALLLHLSSPESPLPELTFGYTPPTTVFFGIFSIFFVYSFQTAKLLYSALFVASIFLVRATYVNPSPALKNGPSAVYEILRGMGASAAAFVGSMVGVNLVALIMRFVVQNPMSWFAVETSCLVLYGPAALTGALATQLLFNPIRERNILSSLLILHSLLALGIQLIGFGSSALFFISGLPLFVALAVNSFIAKENDDVSLWTYVIGQFMPLTAGAQMVFTTLDVFVPLTGRMGEDAPAEHIIAIIVAINGTYAIPLLLPFVHRFSRRFLKRAILVPLLCSAVSIAIFARREPFDMMHPKRLFVLHMENITSQEQHLHVASADGAAGFDLLAVDIADQFGANGSLPTPGFESWESDWDVIYPFSEFLVKYKVDLPLKSGYLEPPTHDFTVTAHNETIDEVAGTRKFTLEIKHPNIIWTVVAFDAYVLEWSIDDSPPDEFARHHIREGSFYGHDTWSADFVVKLPPTYNDSSSASLSPSERAKIKFNFVGVHEQAMWPGKEAEKHLGGRGMRVLEDFDAWVSREKGSAFDTTLLGCVGGVAWV